MNLQQSTTSVVEHPGARKEAEIRLQGVWLMLARIAWVAISLLAVGLFVASLPSYFAYLHIPGLILCLIVLQIYRYRRVSTPIQPQQTKWVIAGFANH